MSRALTRRRFAAAGSAALSTIAIVRGPAGAAPFQWRLAHDLAASHPIGIGAIEFAAAVKRESNGRMEVTVFPDSQLGGDPAMVAQLRANAIQMNLQASGPLSAVSAVAGIVFVGYAFKDRKTAIAAMDGALGGIIRRDLSTKNLVMFDKSWEAGFRNVSSSTRPIRTVDDLAGFKLRVPVSAITIDMWKTLGAAPTPIAANELYTALQTRIVDGADGPFINMYAQKLYEVQKFLSITNHQYSAYWMVVNGDAWKTLPPDLQAIVRRASDAAGVREVRTSGAQSKATEDLLVRYGMKVNDAETSAFRARLTPYYTRWKNEFGPAVWTALEEYSGKLG